MAIAARTPMSDILTDAGRVDVKRLAREIDVTIPTLAKVLGKTANFLNAHPDAPSLQPRALQIANRVNELAGELGGLRFAVAFLKTPTRELGERSPLEVLANGESGYQAALSMIDSFLAMDPD